MFLDGCGDSRVIQLEARERNKPHMMKCGGIQQRRCRSETHLKSFQEKTPPPVSLLLPQPIRSAVTSGQLCLAAYDWFKPAALFILPVLNCKTHIRCMYSAAYLLPVELLKFDIKWQRMDSQLSCFPASWKMLFNLQRHPAAVTVIAGFLQGRSIPASGQTLGIFKRKLKTCFF